MCKELPFKKICHSFRFYSTSDHANTKIENICIISCKNNMKYYLETQMQSKCFLPVLWFSFHKLFHLVYHRLTDFSVPFLLCPVLSTMPYSSFLLITASVIFITRTSPVLSTCLRYAYTVNLFSLLQSKAYIVLPWYKFSFIILISCTWSFSHTSFFLLITMYSSYYELLFIYFSNKEAVIIIFQICRLYIYYNMPV